MLCPYVADFMGEVIGLSHRVIIMRAGRIVGELVGDDIGEDGIVRYAMGLDGVGSAPRDNHLGR